MATQVKYKVTPQVNTESIDFVSANPVVASIVQETRVITANAVGVTTIDLYRVDGFGVRQEKMASLTVTVVLAEVHADSIVATPNNLTIVLGDSVELVEDDS